MSAPQRPWPDQNGRIAMLGSAVVAAAIAMAVLGEKARSKGSKDEKAREAARRLREAADRIDPDTSGN